MRLWSLHPEYLDAKGLVALWREALLAKHVLEGKTKGYKFHPQLDRFKNTNDPVAAIHTYLSVIHAEAIARGYVFDKSKFKKIRYVEKMTVQIGQIAYEKKHLLLKLKVRDPQQYQKIRKRKEILPHPLFDIIPGPVEPWEIL